VNSPAPGARHITPEPQDKTGQQFLSPSEQEAPTSSTADAAKQVPQAGRDEGNRNRAEEASCSNDGDRQTEGDPSAWREELAARLDRYRERRKPRAPRYPSLQLRFEQPSLRPARPGPLDYAPHESVLPPVSCQAVALDRDLPTRPDMGRILRQQGEAAALSVAASSPASPRVTGSSSGHSAGGKIIEFPRSCAVPPVPLDELAEPVTDRPRILDAPAVAPPPPALGGITMEAPESKEAEKRPGIDIPLQSAPLGRRIFAAIIDGAVIAAASALCGFIFSKVSAVRPPVLQLAELAAGVPCLLWAVYQYLLIVYSASTPGLRLARLELNNFDGKTTTRRIRRWRVLASFLSTASLGMGYAWVFLDEDSLCWHDRITHTYLAPKRVGS
jgi:RDD family protein